LGCLRASWSAAAAALGVQTSSTTSSAAASLMMVAGGWRSLTAQLPKQCARRRFLATLRSDLHDLSTAYTAYQQKQSLAHRARSCRLTTAQSAAAAAAAAAARATRELFAAGFQYDFMGDSCGFGHQTIFGSQPLKKSRRSFNFNQIRLDFMPGRCALHPDYTVPLCLQSVLSLTICAETNGSQRRRFPALVHLFTSQIPVYPHFASSTINTKFNTTMRANKPKTVRRPWCTI
jgi:hypothetical protein